MLNVKFIREVWIPKLRGGEIKQGCCYLHIKDIRGQHSMCCMGVAYDATPNKKWLSAGVNTQAYITHWGSSTGYLDDETRKLIGLEGWHEKTLVDLNDSQKKDFNHIADVLEEWCKEQENTEKYDRIAAGLV